MLRRQKRKIVLIAVLLLLLLFMGLYFAYFQSTKLPDVDFSLTSDDTLAVPQYLYSFSGPEDDLMMNPLGVAVVGDEVYVTDSLRKKVYVCALDGEFLRDFGGEEMLTPLYIAENPEEGTIYVSDRRKRAVHIYNPDGTYIGDFDPDLPEDQRPAFETGDVEWMPLALDFATDGTMYCTDILSTHRLLAFSPDGDFKMRAGEVGAATDAESSREPLLFPNGVKFYKDEIWVSDSNNGRMQVFSAEGEFDRVVPLGGGLPRGFDFLAALKDEAATDKLIVVDTLAHDCTILNLDGKKILTFGMNGVLEGQFNYPNDLAVGPKNLIFVTDSSNARVQVWGWPSEVSPVPLPEIAQHWRWCLSPLLLLPLLFLLRKKHFFATGDFVEMMLTIGMIDQMPERRRKWLVTKGDYGIWSKRTQGDIDMKELLHETEHSESDTHALMDKSEINYDAAVILSMAQRARIFCTQDEELRHLAKVLEIDVVNHEEFLERFPKKSEGVQKERSKPRNLKK